MSAFSVAMTDGSSMKIRHAWSPDGGAVSSIQRSPFTRTPMSRNASRCGSSRRRPMKSPPGGGIRASPKRASRGPAIKNEARIRAARSSGGEVSATESARRRSSLSLLQMAWTPRLSSRPTWASVSRIRGTLRRMSSSSVSRQAAMVGRAAFLFPATVISPERGWPPLMTNFSMGGG